MNLEFGVAAGESIRYMAGLYPDDHFYGFDSFEGLPEAWHAHKAGEYTQHGILPEVPENVTLIKGWFNDTLPEFVKKNKAKLEKEKISFLHIDSDIYSACVTVLDHLGKYLKVGTVISFDEYWNFVTWEHDEAKAWDEFLQKNPNIKYEYVAYVPRDTQLTIKITAI